MGECTVARASSRPRPAGTRTPKPSSARRATNLNSGSHYRRRDCGEATLGSNRPQEHRSCSVSTAHAPPSRWRDRIERSFTEIKAKHCPRLRFERRQIGHDPSRTKNQSFPVEPIAGSWFIFSSPKVPLASTTLARSFTKCTSISRGAKVELDGALRDRRADLSADASSWVGGHASPKNSEL